MKQRFPLPRLEALLETWETSVPSPPKHPAHTIHQVGQVSQPCIAVAAQDEEPGHSKGKPAGQNLQILLYPVPEEAQEN